MADAAGDPLLVVPAEPAASLAAEHGARCMPGTVHNHDPVLVDVSTDLS